MSKERACCFFGHNSTPSKIEEPLRALIRHLITTEGIKKFYVGNHGSFDSYVYCALKEIKTEFPDIEYTVVIAYLRGKKDDYTIYSPEETLFPDGIERVPKKYAILWRNDWMLKQCDTMVCYIYHTFGGSGRMLEKAQKQKKKIYNLADTLPG